MNNRILVFGDSITWGAWDSKGGWATRLKKHTDTQAIENKEDYNTVYPLGISGDTTKDLLTRFKIEFNSRLNTESNIVLIIAIGINDSQFEITNGKNKVSLSDFTKNLDEIINIARPHVSKILFIGLTPVVDKLLNPMPWLPTHGYSNKHIEEFDKKLKKIASKKDKVGYIDLYNIFKATNYKKLLSDGVHPNTKGHQLIYEIVLKELQTLNILE